MLDRIQLQLYNQKHVSQTILLGLKEGHEKQAFIGSYPLANWEIQRLARYHLTERILKFQEPLMFMNFHFYETVQTLKRWKFYSFIYCLPMLMDNTWQINFTEFLSKQYILYNIQVVNLFKLSLHIFYYLINYSILN